MKIEIPDKIHTSWFIISWIAFIIIITVGIVIINSLDTQLQTKSPTNVIWNDVDFLLPNLIWLIIAFAFALHGFSFIKVINDHSIVNEYKNENKK